ncbi:unnamed protein product [Parnassius mnemosyne]|uniref:Uncharacterized protein n=1 Tax=Parnassius mnemosyne TaxID=213953 RepID=A0AAV1L3A3_9NEOP
MLQQYYVCSSNGSTRSGKNHALTKYQREIASKCCCVSYGGSAQFWMLFSAQTGKFYKKYSIPSWSSRGENTSAF